MSGITEADLQQAVFRWAGTRPEPELKWLHAVPNGEKRDPATARRLKDQGVKPGILDLHLPVARGKYHGLMIELKRPNSPAKPSIEQDEYMAFLKEQGYCCHCLNDFDAVKALILTYLSM
jgi:hypothetical protein